MALLPVEYGRRMIRSKLTLNRVLIIIAVIVAVVLAVWLMHACHQVFGMVFTYPVSLFLALCGFELLGRIDRRAWRRS